jgi:hypothetical protein
MLLSVIVDIIRSTFRDQPLNPRAYLQLGRRSRSGIIHVEMGIKKPENRADRGALNGIVCGSFFVSRTYDWSMDIGEGLVLALFEDHPR